MGTQWGQGLRRTVVAAIVVALILVVTGFRLSDAAHESTNVLTFEPPAGAAAGSSGAGQITYNGGPPEASRWTATFAFDGFLPGSPYAVVVMGRFGADGTAEATAFTPICQFVSGPAGAGVCWVYFEHLRRLGVVEVRQGEPAGPVILRATRSEGPGAIGSTPNAFSPPPPTPTPGTPAPATPVIATPIEVDLASPAAMNPGDPRR